MLQNKQAQVLYRALVSLNSEEECSRFLEEDRKSVV